jgi:hypothetical protein
MGWNEARRCATGEMVKRMKNRGSYSPCLEIDVLKI